MAKAPPYDRSPIVSPAVGPRARPRLGVWSGGIALEGGLVLTLGLTAIFVAIFGALSLLNYAHFAMGGDLTDYSQIVWNTVHGRVLQITNIGAPGNSLRGGHTEPILLLVALPYALLPDPRTLLVLQTLALGAGGPLVYRLARVHGHGQAAAATLALFYFLFPHVHYAGLHEFHPDPFAVPLLLGALLAFDLRRWGWVGVLVALTLLVKEQMAVYVFGMGCYWWLFRGERAAGQLTAAAAVLYTLGVLIPWYLLTSSQYAHDYGAFFGGLQRAASSAGAHAGAVDRLQAIARTLAEPDRRNNLLLAALPSGFLCLLDASALIALLPLAGLFAGDRHISDIWFHHYVSAVPVVLYATSRALARPFLVRRAAALSAGLVAWTAVVGYLYAAQPICEMHWIHAPSTVWTAGEHARAQAAFIRAVPPDASLAADPPLAAHLANRTTLYRLWDPREVRYAAYILVDLHADAPDPGIWLGMELRTERAALAAMARIGGYRLLRADRAHGLALYANCRGFPGTLGCAPGPG